MSKSITGHFKYCFMQIILKVAGSRVPRSGAGDCDERGFEPRYFLPGNGQKATAYTITPNSSGLWARRHDSRYCCTAATRYRPQRTTCCPKGHFNKNYSGVLFWTLTLVILSLHKGSDLRKMNAKQICSLCSRHLNTTGSASGGKKY